MNPNLLLSSFLRDQPLITPYFNTDTRDAYVKNIAKDPAFRAAWLGRSVTYRLNTDHYRCPEWHSVDWNNSILMLGCSFTFGVGLDDLQTIGHNLSSIMGTPVINLGQPASSWTFQWINTVRLISAGACPRAVIYIWPDVSRYTRMLDSRLAQATGSWNVQGLGLEYLRDTDHARAMSGEILACVRALWSCPQLHYTWSTLVDPEWALPQLTAPIDRARDLMHPGPETVRSWAGLMAQELNNSFLPLSWNLPVG
jgi:hypothetical protein